MTLKLAYNTTESVVVVDEAGHTIGGRGWGPVDSTDPLAKSAYDLDFLVDADEASLAASENPDALAAVAALAERRQRLEAAQALSKPELVDALPAEVVDSLPAGGDGLPPKNELVAAVVADGEPVPAPAPETTTTRSSRSAAKQK